MSSNSSRNTLRQNCSSNSVENESAVTRTSGRTITYTFTGVGNNKARSDNTSANNPSSSRSKWNTNNRYEYEAEESAEEEYLLPRAAQKNKDKQHSYASPSSSRRTCLQMVLNSIKELHSSSGVSRQKIKNFIFANYDRNFKPHHFKAALNKALAEHLITQVTTNSFKLSETAKNYSSKQKRTSREFGFKYEIDEPPQTPFNVLVHYFLKDNSPFQSYFSSETSGNKRKKNSRSHYDVESLHDAESSSTFYAQYGCEMLADFILYSLLQRAEEKFQATADQLLDELVQIKEIPVSFIEFAQSERVEQSESEDGEEMALTEFMAAAEQLDHINKIKIIRRRGVEETIYQLTSRSIGEAGYRRAKPIAASCAPSAAATALSSAANVFGRGGSKKQREMHEHADWLRELKPEYYKRRDEFISRHFAMFEPFLTTKSQINGPNNPNGKLYKSKRVSTSKYSANYTGNEENTSSRGSNSIEPVSTKYSEFFPYDPSAPRDNVYDGNKATTIPQPSFIQNKLGYSLRPYQLRGYQFLCDLHDQGASAILADEMGLGKTAQTIAFLAWLKQERSMNSPQHRTMGPHLIVCPLGVMETWTQEVKNWAPHIKAVRFHGSPTERQRILNEELIFGQFDVCVTSYETVVVNISTFQRLPWCYVIVDEAHRMKSEVTLLSVAMRSISSFNRLLLTGTPTQNNMHEVWALLNYLYPTIFVDSEPFDKAFDLSTNSVNPDRLLQAQSMLKPFMLKRIKLDVCAEGEYKLPSKTEVIVHCKLAPYQSFWYKRLLSSHAKLLESVEKQVMQENKQEIAELNGETIVENFEVGKDSYEELASRVAAAEEKKLARSNKKDAEDDMTGEFYLTEDSNEWRKLLNLMMQLRKCCLSPLMFRDAEFDPMPENFLVESSGKMQILDKLLTKLKADGHRVLIFSNFTSMLNIIEDYVREKQFKYLRLDGSTSRVVRKYEINRFNTDHSFFLYLISTKAGGLGINLQSADTVIHFDSDWNPQNDLQAQDRCHRLGQKKPVRVYRLMMTGTVEEKVIARAQKKLYLDAMVTAGRSSFQSQQQQMEKLSKKELLSMLKFGCDNIFKSQGEITDEDIDVILGRAAVNMANAQFLPEEQKESASGLFAVEHNAANFDISATKELVTESGKYSFQGKTYGRENRDEREEDCFLIQNSKRERTGTTIKIGQDAVLKENNYEIDNEYGRAWGKQDRGQNLEVGYLLVPEHESYCHACRDGGELVLCQHCPRVYHADCLGYNPSSIFICPQHRCYNCDRNAADTGGVLFRCIYCPDAACDDCAKDDMLPTDSCSNAEATGYKRPKNCYWVLCSKECQQDYADERKVIEKEESIRAKEPSRSAWAQLTAEERKRLQVRYRKTKNWCAAEPLSSISSAYEKLDLLRETCGMIHALHYLMYNQESAMPKSATKRRVMAWEGLQADINNKKAWLESAAQFLLRFQRELRLWRQDSWKDLIRIFEFETRTPASITKQGSVMEHSWRPLSPGCDPVDATLLHMALFFLVPNQLNLKVHYSVLKGEMTEAQAERAEKAQAQRAQAAAKRHAIKAELRVIERDYNERNQELHVQIASLFSRMQEISTQIHNSTISNSSMQLSELDKSLAKLKAEELLLTQKSKLLELEYTKEVARIQGTSLELNSVAAAVPAQPSSYPYPPPIKAGDIFTPSTSADSSEEDSDVTSLRQLKEREHRKDQAGNDKKARKEKKRKSEKQNKENNENNNNSASKKQSKQSKKSRSIRNGSAVGAACSCQKGSCASVRCGCYLIAEFCASNCSCSNCINIRADSSFKHPRAVSQQDIYSKLRQGNNSSLNDLDIYADEPPESDPLQQELSRFKKKHANSANNNNTPKKAKLFTPSNSKSLQTTLNFTPTKGSMLNDSDRYSEDSDFECVAASARPNSFNNSKTSAPNNRPLNNASFHNSVQLNDANDNDKRAADFNNSQRKTTRGRSPIPSDAEIIELD
jgi:SWI/SNF-related matrix-associated actin-dependent regulator of chromatin subfamily A member 5